MISVNIDWATTQIVIEPTTTKKWRVREKKITLPFHCAFPLQTAK